MRFISILVPAMLADLHASHGRRFLASAMSNGSVAALNSGEVFARFGIICLWSAIAVAAVFVLERVVGNKVDDDGINPQLVVEESFVYLIAFIVTSFVTGPLQAWLTASMMRLPDGGSSAANTDAAGFALAADVVVTLIVLLAGMVWYLVSPRITLTRVSNEESREMMYERTTWGFGPLLEPTNKARSDGRKLFRHRFYGASARLLELVYAGLWTWFISYALSGWWVSTVWGIHPSNVTAPYATSDVGFSFLTTLIISAIMLLIAAIHRDERKEKPDAVFNTMRLVDFIRDSISYVAGGCLAVWTTAFTIGLSRSMFNITSAPFGFLGAIPTLLYPVDNTGQTLTLLLICFVIGCLLLVAFAIYAPFYKMVPDTDNRALKKKSLREPKAKYEGDELQEDRRYIPRVYPAVIFASAYAIASVLAGEGASAVLGRNQDAFGHRCAALAVVIPLSIAAFGIAIWFDAKE